MFEGHVEAETKEGELARVAANTGLEWAGGQSCQAWRLHEAKMGGWQLVSTGLFRKPGNAGFVFPTLGQSEGSPFPPASKTPGCSVDLSMFGSSNMLSKSADSHKLIRFEC